MHNSIQLFLPLLLTLTTLCAIHFLENVRTPHTAGPMTLRFIRRSLRQAWLITRGFAMKTATRSEADARELFFDQQSPTFDI